MVLWKSFSFIFESKILARNVKEMYEKLRFFFGYESNEYSRFGGEIKRFLVHERMDKKFFVDNAILQIEKFRN